MFGSTTDHPRWPGRHGVGSPTRWFKEKGRGDFITWGTHPRVIEARFRAKAAIAEGLEQYREEAYTFGLFEEIETEGLECDDWFDSYDWAQAEVLNDTFDLMFEEYPDVAEHDLVDSFHEDLEYLGARARNDYYDLDELDFILGTGCGDPLCDDESCHTYQRRH